MFFAWTDVKGSFRTGYFGRIRIQILIRSVHPEPESLHKCLSIEPFYCKIVRKDPDLGFLYPGFLDALRIIEYNIQARKRKQFYRHFVLRSIEQWQLLGRYKILKGKVVSTLYPT